MVAGPGGLIVLQPGTISHRVYRYYIVGLLGYKLPGSRLFGLVKGIFFQVPLAVNDGRTAAVFFEEAVEVRQVVKT